MVCVFFNKNELIKLIPRVCHKIGAALRQKYSVFMIQPMLKVLSRPNGIEEGRGVSQSMEGQSFGSKSYYDRTGTLVLAPTTNIIAAFWLLVGSSLCAVVINKKIYLFIYFFKRLLNYEY